MEVEKMDDEEMRKKILAIDDSACSIGSPSSFNLMKRTLDEGGLDEAMAEQVCGLGLRARLYRFLSCFFQKNHEI